MNATVHRFWSEFMNVSDVSMQSDKNFTEEAEQVRHILSISEGFLAGEDTPVWIAYRPDNSTSVSYMKLKQGVRMLGINIFVDCSQTGSTSMVLLS